MHTAQPPKGNPTRRVPRLHIVNEDGTLEEPVEMDETAVMEGKEGDNSGRVGDDSTTSSGGGHKSYSPSHISSAQRFAVKENQADMPIFKNPLDLLLEEPDMNISEHVNVKGDMKYNTLLRIDGSLRGNIMAPPSAGVVIGPTGQLYGNILGIGTCLIEGKVVGNVNAESVAVTETGQVHGDISARSLDMKPSSILCGQLHISAFDPYSVVDRTTGNINGSRRLTRKFLGTLEDEEMLLPPEREDIDDKPKRRGRDRIILLILDPQIDFHLSGSCPITGADEDAERIADFILTNLNEIDEIFVTLDSHHRMHIAHSIFWENEEGRQPDPYTTISYQDVEDGIWLPRDRTLVEYCRNYIKSLEMKGKGLMHTIKPEHCIIGSNGHCVQPIINAALQTWITQRMRKVNYTYKGTNVLADFTSVFKADVPVPDEPDTEIDPVLIQRLSVAKRLFICGQSLSHTINFSIKDLLQYWPHKANVITILKDCCSVNTDLQPDLFDKANFFKDMKKVGVSVQYSREAFLETEET